MSDYVKIKAIRLPIPQEILDKCDDLEEYFEQQLGDLFNDCHQTGRFTIEYTDNNKYLDYVLDYEYGVDCGDYGFAFNLNDSDKVKYVPLFKNIGYKFHIGDLRKVVYCYYNGCEPLDYYDVSEDLFEDL